MTFDELENVNREFNAREYKADPENHDDWTPIDLSPDGTGDCDSYATAKAERLIKMGWAKSALRVAFCYTETGEGHLVLLCDLAGQTWVLDNRYPYPMKHSDLRYTWKEFGHIATGKWEMA